MVQDWNMIEGSIVLTSCYAEEQKGEGGGGCDCKHSGEAQKSVKGVLCTVN